MTDPHRRGAACPDCRCRRHRPTHADHIERGLL